MSMIVAEGRDCWIPVQELRHDVPVDRAHVEVLKRSIRERGQLSPILVWAKDNSIIDGFHRLTACKELASEGLTPYSEINTRVIDCTEDEFRNDRIISACMHKGVSFARITLWVQELFLATKWASKLRASEAFRIGGKQGEHISMHAFEKHWGKNLNGGELYEIAAWVKEKAAIWGLSPDQIANMLHLAELASPMLIPLVTERKHTREGVLTRTMLKKLVTRIPDHDLQEAVAKKAMAEKLTEQEAATLIGKAATAPPERLPTILTTSWLDQKSQGRVRSYSQLSEDETQHRSDQFFVDMTMGVAKDLAERLQALVEVPRHKDTDTAALSVQIDRVLVWIARYRGYGGSGAPSSLDQLEDANKTLHLANLTAQAENVKLREEVERVQRLLQTGRKMYNEDTKRGA